MGRIIYGSEYRVADLAAFWPSAWKFFAAGAIIIIEETEEYRITASGTFAGNNARTFLNRGGVTIKFPNEPMRQRSQGITTHTSLATLRKHIDTIKSKAGLAPAAHAGEEGQSRPATALPRPA